MRRAGGALISIGLLLAACSVAAVDSAMQRRAERFAAGEMRPLALAPIASWYSDGSPGGMICGELEAPAAIHRQQKTLRYFYSEIGGKPVGQVEQHAGVIGTDATSNALLAENRSLFDSMWATHCQGYAPLPRRIAGWFGSPRSAPTGETPLTNAYVDDLLGSGEKRR